MRVRVFGNYYDRKSMAIFLAVAQQFANLGDSEGMLGNQDDVRAARNSSVSCNPSGVTAHYFHDHYAIRRLGRRLQTIDRAGNYRTRGVESESEIGSANTVVERRGTA